MKQGGPKSGKARERAFGAEAEDNTVAPFNPVSGNMREAGATSPPRTAQITDCRANGHAGAGSVVQAQDRMADVMEIRP